MQLNRLDIPIPPRLRFYGCGKAALAHYMEFFLMSDFDNEKLCSNFIQKLIDCLLVNVIKICVPLIK